MGRFAESLALRTEVLALAERIGELPHLVIQHQSLGLTLYEAGRLGEAEVHLRRSIALARQIDVDQLAVGSEQNLANLLAVDGRLEEAATLLRRAVASYREWKRPLEIARALNNLAADEERALLAGPLAPVWGLLSQALGAAARWEEGLDAAERGVAALGADRAVDRVEACALRALHLAHLGRGPEARAALADLRTQLAAVRSPVESVALVVACEVRAIAALDGAGSGLACLGAWRASGDLDRASPMARERLQRVALALAPR